MDTLPDNKPPAAKAPSALRKYAGMGTELAGAICGLTLAGYWFDRHFQTGVKATVTGVLIGVVGGMYNFIRQAISLSKDSAVEMQRHREQSGAHDQHDGKPHD